MDLRFGFAVGLLSLSIAVIVSHSVGSIYPWLPLMLLFYSIFILSSDSSIQTKAFILIFGGVYYIGYIYLFTSPVLINMDPDKVAVAISRIIRFGSIDRGLEAYVYYSNVPGFHSLGAVIGIVTGTSGVDSIRIIGLLFLTTTGLGAAYFGSQIAESNTTIISTIVAILSTSVLYYSFSPIPQLYAVMLWTTFLVCFDRFSSHTNKPRVVVLTLISIALIFSHKLSFIFLASFIACFLFLGRILNRGSSTPNARMTHVKIFGVIIFIFGLIQNIWVSEFLNVIIIAKLPAVLTGLESAASPSYTDAIPANSGLSKIIVENGDWILLTGLSGIGWVMLFYNNVRSKNPPLTLLTSGMITGVAVPAAIFAPSTTGTRRILLFASVPFAILTGILLSNTISSRTHFIKRTGKAILFLTLVSQLFVIGAVPDHPNEPREYLQPQEISGKEWANTYAQEPISADYFYAREVVSFNRPDQTYVTGQLEGVSEGYIELGDEYLNHTIDYDTHSRILYRSNYNIFQYDGEWILQWNPEQEFDSKMHRLFDSGGSIYYSNPKRSN